MPWRSKVMQILDVILRVPPLFVVDSILNKTFLTPIIPEDMTFFGPMFILWVLIVLTCFMGSMLVCILSTKLLMDVYCKVFASVVLFLSYQFNKYYAETFSHEENGGATWPSVLFEYPAFILGNACLQLTLAYFYNSWRLDWPWYTSVFYSGLRKDNLRRMTYLSFLQVVIAHVLALSGDIIIWTPVLAVGLPACEFLLTLLISILPLTRLLYRGYLMVRYMIRTYGIQNFLETQWTRLHIPNVLRVFCIARLTYHVILLCLYKASSEDGASFSTLSWEDLKGACRELLVSECETVVALLGMTSVISYITHYVGIVMATFIGSENEEDRNMGTVSAILFFILALQTGLTGLEPDKRLIRLYRNLCLLMTAILHFIHSMVNPLLMSLSAQRNMSFACHGRVLTMCAFLVTFPSWFLFYLWSQHSISTWLLAVTAFSVEVVIKVFISLLVYLLFMVDAYRDTFWEKLDDYVYYIKSTGNTIEFLFGIFLFCNGAWIMLFESGGTIRAIMMCIHAYFNIWVQAKEGWKIFMKRRTAVNKINSLPLASAAELRLHNDVCAICYQELTNARMTRCKHFFHGVCLRKWLYVQDRCPMCHELIYVPEQEQSDNNGTNQDGMNHVNNDPNQNQVNHVPGAQAPVANQNLDNNVLGANEDIANQNQTNHANVRIADPNPSSAQHVNQLQDNGNNVNAQEVNNVHQRRPVHATNSEVNHSTDQHPRHEHQD